MARHYSTRDFFRQMPNALLARYFQARGLFGELDFAAMKETQPDELFAAWLLVPDGKRNEMDTEFRVIFELSCEKGFAAIRDEAHWHYIDQQKDPAAYTAFVEKLAALSNHFERAMLTFLDHNTFWKGASLFYHADTLPYWRKRKNLPHVPAAVDAASLQQLEGLIRTYFHQTDGRGNNCFVEPFRRGDLDYFFAYPEDYSQQAIEWVDGKFDRRPHNPAFEVIYVYSRKDGSLDLNFRGTHILLDVARGEVDMLQLHRGDGAVPRASQQRKCDEGAVAALDRALGRHQCDDVLHLFHGRPHLLPPGRAGCEVRWHGRQDGVVNVGTSKLKVTLPRLRDRVFAITTPPGFRANGDAGRD